MDERVNLHRKGRRLVNVGNTLKESVLIGKRWRKTQHPLYKCIDLQNKQGNKITIQFL